MNRFEGIVQFRNQGFDLFSTFPKSQTHPAFMECYGTMDRKYDMRPRTRNIHCVH